MCCAASALIPSTAYLHVAVAVGELQAQWRRHGGAVLGVRDERPANGVEDQVGFGRRTDGLLVEHEHRRSHVATVSSAGSGSRRPMPMRNRSVGVSVSPDL
jgi:hypothetical protein